MALLAVTPNPALDRTLVVPNLRLGEVRRPERVLPVAGGKGLNVARAARTLNLDVQVTGILAGFTGQLIAHLAANEGLRGDWFWRAAGETRTCSLLVDPMGGDTTGIYEQGDALAGDEWQAFSRHLLRLAEDAELVSISGSLPPGVSEAEFRALLEQLVERGRRVIVDTSGTALAAAMAVPIYGIKVNAAEISVALGREVVSVEDAVAAVAMLQERGIHLPAVTLGAEGAVAADGATILKVCPPQIEARSSAGSGDSFLAGLACGLLQGRGLRDTLRLGAACGAADALTVGGGLIELPTVQRLFAQTTLVPAHARR